MVDATISQYQTLLEQASTTALTSRPITELTELNALIAQDKKYSGLHLITHGKSGEILLAGHKLAPRELATQLDQLLLPGAPLYLYACNLAQDPKGQAFVDNLASILARPVLASTNATGNKRLGGDWQLEYSTSSTMAARTLFSGDVRGFNTLLSNTAYEFSDGDAVTLTNAASALANDSTFTLEMWANFSSTSGIINLMDITGSLDAGGFIIYNNTMTVDLSGDFSSLTQSNPITISTNVWYHFAFVFNNGQWDFYLDGQATGIGVADMGGNNTVPDYQAANVNNLVAGRQNHGAVNNFTGKIDDIRLWSTARTQTEIQNNRQLELAGNETGLIGYWKLNETSGTVVNDSQTNGSILQGSSIGVTLGVAGAFSGNQSPTDISLSNNSVSQSGGSNAVVGTLTTTDADVGDSFSYALIAGSGDTNNGSFNLSGDSLRANNASTLVGGSYSIRVQTTDSGNATFEKAFSITVVDDLAPEVTGITIDGSPADTATSISYTVSFNELANNISTDDFNLTNTGSAAGNIASASASSGTSVTVTINNISGNGSLRLDLKAATNISDAQANSGPAAYTSGDVHTVAVPTVPGAPIIGTASALDGQAVVNFSAPASDGGSAITSYQVTSSPGGITASGANSPIGVAGLTNGTSYTFTVQAINAVGTSSPSAPSNSVVPKANQTISFNNPGAQDFGTTPTLAATASSGLTPVFSSSTTGVCTITASGTLTFVTTGNCSIDADQPGDSSYNAAPTVTQSFTVNAVVPGAPTSVNAVASDASATVSFSAPASTGGAAISGYTVTSSPGGLTASGAGSPLTVSGLSNGTDYSFTVSANNTAGTGPASSPSNTVTPKANQTISFSNPGAQSFGTTPTLTATASSGLTPVFSSSTTGVCTITASGTLTFVTTGNCSIDADQPGDSSYNAAPTVTQSFTVNAVVPGAPTSVNAVASDASATVSFSAPASTGGAAISSYTVTSSPGGLTASGAGSPLTVSGLSNGTDYSFTVSASNTAGTGPASSHSNTVTPKANQTINFNNPGAQSFGTTPTLTATASSGLTPVFSSNSTGVCTITTTGTLSFISTGSCSINADQAGDSSYNAALTVIQSFTVNAVVPGAPIIGTASALDGQAVVNFSAPASDGGSAITSYQVTSSPGGITASGANSPIGVAGLTNGTSYTFTVQAINAVGTSSPSAPSNSVVPKANQTISFNNPGAQDFGTTPTLAATASSGLTPVFSSSTTGVCTITASGTLTFVTTGNCSIDADQPGDGSYNAAPTVTQGFTVNAVVPGAPTSVNAVASDASATVSFSAPASTGGAAISSYTVTSSPGGLTASGAGSPLIVSGLSNGTDYSFTVSANNTAGSGQASSPSNTVTPKANQTISFNNPGAQSFGTTPTLTATASSGLTPVFSSTTTGVCTITSTGTLAFVTTGNCSIDADQAGDSSYNAAPTVTQSFTVNAVVPGAPTSVNAVASDASATVSFSAPASTGGAAISSYTVTSSPGGITASGAGSPLTVSGLSNGTDYSFTVSASNTAGTGPASSSSNTVTPKASQSISFNNPGAQSFGTTPTLTATASSGLAPVFSSNSTGVCTITTTGTLNFISAGSCSINADQAGDSSYNAAPTVTQSFTVNAVVPGAPMSVSAVAADASATVSFSAPASTGGAAISSYTVTSSPGGFTASGTGSPLTVSGLSNGTDYSFIVSASNIAGTGPTSSPSNTVTPEPDNKAPSISGTPAGSVDQDSYYSFIPTATDPDQDPLTFSISNKPAWASFNTASGELSGTPLREHVGVSDNIIIRVSDGALSTDLAPFSVEVKAVNQAPQANHDRITQAFSQENSYLLDVLANDSDPDDDPLTIVDISASLGTATVQGDKLQLTVPENFNGQVRLSYSITDGEFYDSAKVSFSIEGSNPEAPVINIPADVTANATGLFTRVNLGRVGAIDSDDNPIPVSLLNGFPFFAPGQHLAYWKTTDGKGVSATASQLVTVYPRINLGASKTVANFTRVQVPVLLNGSAPEYPMEIRYSVSGDAIAGQDHDLASGSLLLSQGMSTSLEFNVFADLSAGQQKSLTITLDDGQNPGHNAATEIRISNNNLAPNLSLSASQQGEMRSSVSSSDGLVTVTAEVADPNPADNISLSWSSEPAMTNLSTSANEFTFDPAALAPGIVTLTLNAMDDGSPQLGSSKSLKLLLLAQLPALGETDANNNRLPDSAEGYGDPDGNGIPAYLQGDHPCNVIPEQLSRPNSYLAEAQPGICSRKGLLSLQRLENGIELEDGSMLPDDSEGKIVGGLFDFELEGSEYGGSVSIVIPQVQAIPAQAQYRKYVASGWQEFVTDANNQVFSSAGEPGYCPPMGDSSWQSGLTEGHWCVQLLIQDGGPNDGDGQANGTIVDPGGVAVKLSANQAPIAQADSFSLPWNQQHLLDVLANDNDADNDSLYLVQASVSIGEISVSDDKLSLMYTPPEDFIGNAQLSYTVSDGMGGTAMSHAELVVFYNRAPVVNDSSAGTDDRTAIELEVLSTASDPDGDSLTLESAVAQSGSVSITTSQTLSYQPKTGFAGTDIISFSVSDGNGASATAQVVVTVTAYQEVVVENRSSGGAVAPWALALMLLMAGFRRLSLRLASLPLLLLLAIGVSFSAQARWSVNLNLGYSHARLSESDINKALPAEVKLTELDKDDFAWSVALNYQASDAWALQFGYLDLGETSLMLAGSTLDPQALQQSLANLGPQLASGVTAGAEYRFWRYRDWSFSLNGGIFVWESDFNSQWQQQELRYDDSGVDFYWGLGGQYQLSEQWAIRADYRRYMLDRNQVDGVFIGLEFFF
ncbi:fibronectin type III domain-containing protein [Shewanella algae]|uniref:fibronectin type III domain-containing protein n=2 Tax=Shewanella algae TaxID=38313 RepID=UPI001AACA2FF|nr:fibronectin type III domain-containing protein [Shewanella algae]MBO2643414.1 fibronectin type III domain-containing protein [Shewanella algae]